MEKKYVMEPIASEGLKHFYLAVYNWGASLYDLITTQQYWKGSVQRLTQHLRISQHCPRLLDLGCGAGVSTFALAERFPNAEIIGIDIAKKMIEKAREHHRAQFPHLTNVRFMVADASALPFSTQGFDVAIGHSFLYLIPGKVEVLREVNRVLRRGGQLVLMEPYAKGSLVRTVGNRTDYLRKIWQKPGPTLRFITSIIAWRVFSFFKGQFSTEFVRDVFTEAGFGRVSTVPTLNQLGVYCIGFAG